MSSPIRCRGPWKIHKRTSEPDRWLDEMGYFRKHTARDASCLFRAVSENVYNTQRYYFKVRLECVHFMATQRHLFEGSLTCPFDNYLKEMTNPSEWGGLVEISAMSHLYRRDFVIFEANKGPQTKICNGYGNTIYLFYSSDTKHFDAVYTKDLINTSSFCQSLVYEVLYDGVYQLKELSYAVDKMLHDKSPSNHIEYFMAENVERRKKQKERAKIFIETKEDSKDNNNNAVALKCKHHTEDFDRASMLKESLSIFVFNRSLIQLENVCMNCLNVNSAKDLLDNGITPFPYKVAKALDPDIYRNIEFDVWSEIRRELRYGARYSDGTTLQVGVKCLCKLQEDQAVPYHCHIQEMRPDGGPCLVFIEELGEKRVVNYNQLEPLPVNEVEVQALPLMVDCRPATGAPPHEIAHSAPNGSGPSPPQPNENNHHNQSGGGGGATGPAAGGGAGGGGGGGDSVSSPGARASTPAGPVHPYAGNGPVPMNPVMGMANSYGPYYGGGSKAVSVGPGGGGGALWMGGGPVVGALPPPPHHVNPHVFKSVQPNGADLPMNDIPTLRYYFNLGVECMWAAYGAPPPAPAPAPAPLPPRHYSSRDISQDMQQMSLGGGAGTGGNNEVHKHKGQDKQQQHQNKGNGQRSLLGPRFNKRNNQDGNQNPNHNQNKGHNNNMNNKGPNNRRNSHESRPTGGYPGEGPVGVGAGGGGECVVEGPLMSVPYLPYPPPVYPIQYYPIDSSDPAMMGMMGGMGYVNYEEGGEYMQPYYPHPLYAAPPHPHAPPPPAMHHPHAHAHPHPHHIPAHQDHK